jgi:hypothetical protein
VNGIGEFDREASSTLPIWKSVLLAAGCRVLGSDGSSPVQWECIQDYLRYQANDSITVEPFHIALDAGEILEVTWLTGDTGYTVLIHR